MPGQIVKSYTPFLKKTKVPSFDIAKCVKSRPNTYFFGVLVEDYYELSDLDYIKNDKSLIYKLATCYIGIPEDHILILENPTYIMFKNKIREFVSRIRKKDAILYFYYSGHGVLDSRGNFYILPVDASIKNEQVLKESGINIDELRKLLTKARGKKVVFLDACRIKSYWKPAIIVYMPNLTDTAIIFSTRRGKLSNIDKDGKYSAFTRALYEMARSGVINLDFDNDGYVEIKELKKTLINWVRRVSADMRQTPDFWGPEDFEIFPLE